MTKGDFDREILLAITEEQRLNFLEKYYFHGIPFVFAGDENKYFDFRKRIAKNFNIEFQDVFIIGSGKLGFSVQKETLFSLESDIDVVLVNELLFEEYIKEVCAFQYELSKGTARLTTQENQDYKRFLSWIPRGWIRPDLLPTSVKAILFSEKWTDYFNSISFGKSEVGNYEVNGGLFKSYYYLQLYYIQSLNDYYNKLKIKNG